MSVQRVFSGAAGDTRSPHYQQLKARVHGQLLNRLNLERLTKVSRREARAGDPQSHHRDDRGRGAHDAAQPLRAREPRSSTC